VGVRAPQRPAPLGLFCSSLAAEGEGLGGRPRRFTSSAMAGHPVYWQLERGPMDLNTCEKERRKPCMQHVVSPSSAGTSGQIGSRSLGAALDADEV